MSGVGRYVRKGRCRRCGFCCLGGKKNEPCEHLAWQGTTAVCCIYGRHPWGCGVFPEAPPILSEACGYWFVDTWTKRRLAAREV